MITKFVAHKPKPVKQPHQQANVGNAKGYYDLVVNLNKNGKAIRIADKFNTNRVHITLKEVPDLISALTEIAANGVKTSVKTVEYAA